MIGTIFILKKIYLLTFLLILPFLSYAQIKGSFIDIRDGKDYSTVTYTIPLSDKPIHDIDEYMTYATNEPATYELILIDSMPLSMTWMAQNLNFEVEESKCYINSDVNCELYGRLYTWSVSEKVCPQGWHLPSDNEWYLLANLYGGVSSAGEHLKSDKLGGTNNSLFNITKPSIYWSSDEMDSEYAWDWKVNFRWTKLQRWKGGKGAFNSVRCVQDY